MHKTVIRTLFISLLFFCQHLLAQELDSLLIKKDTMALPVKFNSDTSVLDTTKQDSVIVRKKKKKQVIDQPVKYSAKDSMKIDMAQKKVYLWGEAQIDYQDITLKADYIIFDMASNVVFASGWPDDTTHEIKGKPVFKQGKETFNSEELTYNFKTKKGYIVNIKTDQNGGYLHSEITKRNPNGEVNLKKGKYTTCDLDHPHFYLALSKAKMIPEDKIVSGPAYMVILDVPLPLGLPFGFFPNTSQDSKSGILIPAYGEDKTRGFKLQNGGYYWAINQYMDATITGDIYTRGSWGLNLATNYKARYLYSGRTTLRYFYNKYSETNIVKDYSIIWSHQQDPKANPFRTFSANVNMSSSSFDKQNAMYNPANRSNNTKTSSIMFTRRWPSLPVNMSVGLRHTQNSITGDVTMDLPSFAFNSTTIYPFRRKNPVGKMRWYENIQTMYNSSFENTVITQDSALFTSHAFDSLNTGFKHSIPLSTNIKVGNFFNITPSLNYTGMIYTKYVEKFYDQNAVDTLTNSRLRRNVRDTMAYVQGWAPRIGFTLNPKIYGMYQFHRSRVKAIRHVISPTASFNYTPDISKATWNYDKMYVDYSRRDSTTTSGYSEINYSPYETGRYGLPTPVRSKKGGVQSGILALSIRNTLEMKILSKNDTGVAVKKIPILENFDFTTSFNPFVDKTITKQWSNINWNAGTRLFEGKYNIRMTGIFNPYQYVKQEKLNAATIKNPADRYYYKDTVTFMYEKGQLARLTNLTLSIGTSWRSEQGKKKGKDDDKDKKTNTEINPLTGLPYSGYVDFDIPWSLNVNYDFSYMKQFEIARITQTLRFSGDLSLTKKWKMTFNSGYDVQNKKMSATTFSIIRDLHCWEMRLTCVPFGPSQMYLFSINVRAPMLRDLKWDKRQSWYDTQY